MWSADILQELARNLTERVQPDAVKRLIVLMESAFPESSVVGYGGLVPAMGNDPKDRHVLAAAIKGEADVVVTRNLRDFPQDTVRPYGIEVLHPDEFLLDQLDLAPAEVLAVLHAQARGYRRAPRDVHGLLDRLDAGGVPQFAAEVRRRL
ncbi:PIN domain-containing protein [Streptomyces regalis]|uniref:PIN domain-containing protein n=1 Tax=Streptomyces regalis TaxID=68262 RepID=UPI000AECEC16|nr:PIN domain-containing protein [Streptomyces regalis]